MNSYFPKPEQDGSVRLEKVAEGHQLAVQDAAPSVCLGKEPALQRLRLPESVQPVRNRQVLDFYRDCAMKLENVEELPEKASLACSLHADFARMLSERILAQLARAPQNERAARPVLDMLGFIAMQPQDFRRDFVLRTGLPMRDVISVAEQRIKLRVSGALRSLNNKKDCLAFLSHAGADLRTAFGDCVTAPELREAEADFVYDPNNKRLCMERIGAFIDSVRWNDIGQAFKNDMFYFPKDSNVIISQDIYDELACFCARNNLEILHASHGEFGFAARRIAEFLLDEAKNACDFEELSPDEQKTFTQLVMEVARDMLQQDFYVTGHRHSGPKELKELCASMGFRAEEVAGICLDAIRKQKVQESMVI